MELLFEIVFGLYVELMTFGVSESAKKGKRRVLAVIIAVSVLLITLAMFFAGCILIEKSKTLAGSILIVVSIAVSAFQIVMGIKTASRKE